MIGADLVAHDLSHRSADELRRIAKRWIGKQAAGMNKAALTAAIPRAMMDPAELRRVADHLIPAEATALDVLRRAGGTLTVGALAAGLRFAMPDLVASRTEYQDPHVSVISRMTETELLIRRDMGSYRDNYTSQRVSGYGPLLALVPPQPVRPLALHPVAATTALMPPRLANAVTLDVLALVEAIRAAGGLPLTRAGAPNAVALRQIEKRLGWRDATPEGLAQLRDPLLFFLRVLCAVGVLDRDATRIAAPADPGPLEPLPLARRLLAGYLSVEGWFELPNGFLIDTAQVPLVRRLLAEGLRALPPGTFPADGLADALRARVGQSFTLAYLNYYDIHHPDRAPSPREEQHRAQIRAQDRQWVAAALQGPLRALGLVETGVLDGRTAFRLTALGRSVFSGEEEDGAALEAQRSGQPSWIIQPTFEVLVYLEHASASQMAMLSLLAERVSTHAHTATYRLTEDTVYRALEQGSSTEALLALLERGAGRPLPQNVGAEIRAWDARRQKTTIYPQVRVLEFDSIEAREAALSQGLAGRTVGETLLLVDDAVPPVVLNRFCVRTTDHAAPPARCLEVAPDGALALCRDRGDLWVEGEVSRYAEARGPRTWQLTAPSVREAIKRGATPETILAWLASRAIGLVPQSVRLCVQGWAAPLRGFALGEAVVLTCPDAETCSALLGSPGFAPHVTAALSSTVLQLRREGLAQAREVLRGMGIEPGAMA